MRKRNSSALAVFVAILLAGAGFVGVNLDDLDIIPSSSSSSHIAEQTYTPSGDIVQTISELTVAEPSSMAGYDRDDFSHWDRITTDQGWPAETVATYGKCNAREVVLFEQGENVNLDPDTCDITGGPWIDGYGPEAEVISESRNIDIDHVVALGEAYRSGAADMDQDTRDRLANDPINLLISSPGYNRSKGDQNAADYLPTGHDRCRYVEMYAQTKDKYNLTVTQPEADRLLEAARECTA